MSKLQAELAVHVLHMGTFAHLEHFKTGSYAAHKALETLYTDLPDALADIRTVLLQAMYRLNELS